jgi:hypothetical protein
MRVVDAQFSFLVQPSEEDIANSIPLDHSRCMYCRACARQFGSELVWVTRTLAYVELKNRHGESELVRFILTAPAREKIREFDSGHQQSITPQAVVFAAPKSYQRLDSVYKKSLAHAARERETATYRMSDHIEHSREEWDRINAERCKSEDGAYAKRKAQGEVASSQTSSELVLPDLDEIGPYRPISQEEIAEVKRLHDDIVTTPLKIFRLGQLLASQLELIPHGSKEKWRERTYPEIGLTTIRLWIRIAEPTNRKRLEDKFPIIRQQLPISSRTKTDLDLLPSVRQLRDATMEFEAQEPKAQGKPPIRHRSATKEKRGSRPVCDVSAETVPSHPDEETQPAAKFDRPDSPESEEEESDQRVEKIPANKPKDDNRPILDQIAEDSAKRIGQQLLAEVELQQEEEVGITYQAARQKVARSWERLTREVQRQAQRRYRWLRPDVDPRTEAPKEEPPNAEVLPFDCAASYLADRYTDKNRLIQYGQESRSPDERRAVRECVRYVQEDIEQVEGLLKSDSFWLGPLETMCKYAISIDRYASNHRRDTHLSCPSCRSRIWQIKPPVPIGQGRYWRVWVCECTFVSTSLPLPEGCRVMEAKLWDAAVKRIAERNHERNPA